VVYAVVVSVYLSQICVLLKRLNVESHNATRWPRDSFCDAEDLGKTQTVTPNGGTRRRHMRVGRLKLATLDISGYMSKTVQDRLS